MITREDLAVVLDFADGGVNERGAVKSHEDAIARVRAELTRADSLGSDVYVVWAFHAGPEPWTSA